MRVALVLVLAVVVLIVVGALFGWLSWEVTDDRATLNVESEEIRRDSNEAIDRSGELLRRAGEKLEDPPEKEPEAAEGSGEPNEATDAEAVEGETAEVGEPAGRAD